MRYPRIYLDKMFSMKKSAILFLVILLTGFASQAQVKLGLKFSPTIVTTRAFEQMDTLDIEAADRSFKFALGLIADYKLTETYYLSSGIIVVPKRVGISLTPEGGGTFAPSTEYYDLQYVQIPLTLKLYTNEFAPDASIYFQVGGTMDIKVFEQPVKEEYKFVSEFQDADACVVLGGGFEYRAGLNTVLYTGVTYNRGLGSVVKNTQPALREEFYLRTSVLMIDLGIKF